MNEMAPRPQSGDDGSRRDRRSGSLQRLDFSSFDSPIYEELVLEHADRLESERAAHVPPAPARRLSGALAPVLLSALPGAVLLGIGLVTGDPAWTIAGGAVLVCAVALATFAMRRGSHRDDIVDYRYRLDRFAETNGLHYVSVSPDPPRKGALFSLGDRDRRTENVILWPNRELEVGEYHYSSERDRGSGSPARWWYARIRLDRDLPELRLESNANRGYFGLGRLRQTGGAEHARGAECTTRLRASGGERFSLRSRQGESERARRLADERLLDLLVRLYVDLEIVNGEALLYSQEALGALDPSDWSGLVEIALLLRDQADNPSATSID